MDHYVVCLNLIMDRLVENSPVLLVPVPLVRLQGVLAALDALPDTEEMKQEEE